MKRLSIFLGIVLLFVVIAAPLSARGGRGMGHSPFMGYGPGLDIDPRMGDFPVMPRFSPLTEEQRAQLDERNNRFLEETAEIRKSLSSKFDELNTILTSEKPDEKKAKALQKEISELQVKLSEKRLDFRLDMAKIIPESGLGRGFGRFLDIDPRMGGFPMRPWFSPLTEEQRDQLNELNKKFREETADLREKLSSTSGELSRLLTSEKPDEQKARALQKEISELQAELGQKTLGLRLEMRKILPETETGYTRGFGRVFGPHMGYGPHMGRGRGMGRAPGFF
ncbi:MAG: periplasmic heavy metal sensor [Deltaproteobacteria bacterium]|nr:periplasmic heavy metal sensor [Deltaproteobacteria bacterium]